MTTLRESIKELHDKAEESRFAKLLLSGDITTEQYSDLLFNMYQIYQCLEELCDDFDILKGVDEVKRADLILQDLNELTRDTKGLSPVTVRYTDYLYELARFNPRLLLAHIYVRHFGDLYGGQIIKSKVPGSGRMYEFEDRQGLIAKLRPMLSEDLGNEARIAMQFAVDLFEALADEYNLQ